VGNIDGRPRLRMAAWLQVKVRGRRLGLRPRLFACSVCDTQRQCSSSMRLAALCKCYAFTFTYQSRRLL